MSESLQRVLNRHVDDLDVRIAEAIQRISELESEREEALEVLRSRGYERVPWMPPLAQEVEPVLLRLVPNLLQYSATGVIKFCDIFEAVVKEPSLQNRLVPRSSVSQTLHRLVQYNPNCPFEPVPALRGYYQLRRVGT